MNKIENAFILRWAKKIKATKMLGEKCKICGNSNIFVVEFHHLLPNDKAFEIGETLGHLPLSLILNEVSKCELLCPNCHFESHYIDGRRSKKKNDLLNSLHKLKCGKCGHHGKNLNSLCFHHIDGEKEFNISDFLSCNHGTSQNSVADLAEEIKKCVVLCRNCHKLEHSKDTIELYERFKNKIYERIKTHKGQNRVDMKKIIEFKRQGKGICEIAKIMGLGKSTIHYAYYRTKDPSE